MRRNVLEVLPTAAAVKEFLIENAGANGELEIRTLARGATFYAGVKAGVITFRPKASRGKNYERTVQDYTWERYMKAIRGEGGSTLTTDYEDYDFFNRSYVFALCHEMQELVQRRISQVSS